MPLIIFRCYEVCGQYFLNYYLHFRGKRTIILIINLMNGQQLRCTICLNNCEWYKWYLNNMFIICDINSVTKQTMSQWSSTDLGKLDTLTHCGLVTPDGDGANTIAQVYILGACCLLVPSHYLTQCWLLISEILRHSPKSNFTSSGQAMAVYYQWVEDNSFKMTEISRRGLWVNPHMKNTIRTKNKAQLSCMQILWDALYIYNYAAHI